MAKLSFKTWREDHPRKHCSSGSRTKITYSGRYDKDGSIVLDEVGKEDIYDYIQSFAESVDINNVIKRFTAGDTTALEQVQGIYMDATATPKNMADLMNKISQGKENFEKLPVEFKQLYGNDFVKFICTFDPMKLEELLNNPQNVENIVKETVPSVVQEEKE